MELPREKVLYIAGEIVAAQRLNRSLPGMSSNEPDLTVMQGYAILVRHDVFPLSELEMIGGDNTDL